MSDLPNVTIGRVVLPARRGRRLRRYPSRTMRLSQLFFATLRDDPSDAEMPSHRLLLRAGDHVPAPTPRRVPRRRPRPGPANC